MSEAFPVSGNIEPLTFPFLLVDLHRHGATGSLKVTGATHPKALYFRAGRILFGSSNDSRDQLGAILIDSGRITREQLDEVNAKVGPGNPLAKVLSESGFVSQRELNEAARHKVERILADLLSWDSGTFEFEDGVLPKGSVDLKLSTERLLLAAVQSISNRVFALRHVELGAVLEPVPEGDSVLSEIRADVWPLLERLDGRRTLKDAIALTRLDEFEAVKTACALLFLGVVRKVAVPESQELDLAGEAQSAFGEAEPEPEPAPLYTVPLEPVRQAEATGFAFVEEPAEEEAELPVTFSMPAEPAASAPEPPSYAVPEEPPIATDTVALPFPEEPLFRPEAEADAPTAADVEPFAESSSELPEPEPFAEPLPPLADAPFLAESPGHVNEPVPQPEPTVIDARLAQTPYATPEPTSYVPPPAPLPVPPSFAPEPAATAPYPPARFGFAPEAEPENATETSRPTVEDLAALDALLNPAGTASAQKRSAEQKWEPQFRPSATMPPPRRPPVRVAPAPSAPSRLPILVTALAAVVLTTIAAWYFFLRSPKPTVPAAAPRPVAAATPRPLPTVPAGTPAPPTATAAAPAASPTTAPTASVLPAAAPTPAPKALPTTAPTPTPAIAAARPPAPVPAPATAARPPAPAAATATGDGRTLLAQGALPDAARAFARSVATGSRSRYTAQLLTACAAENVQKAVSAGGSELFILPVSVKGQACYRVCWGLFADRAAAEAGLSGLPAYFRQSGVRPRLSSLAELAP
jgi:hypothetical protein